MPADSSKDHHHHPLIFHWPRPLEQGRKLIFWIGVVTLGLAAFFYLFQVVYPQSRRSTPIPHQVILLDPADPAARAILSKVRDRDFLVLPGEEFASGAMKLEEHAPVFHPSFEGRTLALQEMPHKPFTVPPARLLRVDEPVLPPLDLGDLPPPAASATPGPASAARPPSLALRIEGGLAQRKLMHPPDLSGLTPLDAGAHVLHIGVDANGRVWFALPIRESENGEISRSLAARMLEARFEPLPASAPGAPRLLDGRPPAWGTASFEWRSGQ